MSPSYSQALQGRKALEYVRRQGGEIVAIQPPFVSGEGVERSRDGA